jgi:hypothetical protein
MMPPSHLVRRHKTSGHIIVIYATGDRPALLFGVWQVNTFDCFRPVNSDHCCRFEPTHGTAMLPALPLSGISTIIAIMTVVLFCKYTEFFQSCYFLVIKNTLRM